MKIISATYTKEIDKYDYSKLICKFEDGTDKIFHFHSNNPMPKTEEILGETWDYLIGYCKALWYMYVDMSFDCEQMVKHYFILKGDLR